MKRIALTSALFLGFAVFTSAQGRQSNNANDVKQQEVSKQQENPKEVRTTKSKTINKHEMQQKKATHQEHRIEANDALMRSEDKSSEKLRKEVIK